MSRPASSVYDAGPDPFADHRVEAESESKSGSLGDKADGADQKGADEEGSERRPT